MMDVLTLTTVNTLRHTIYSLYLSSEAGLPMPQRSIQSTRRTYVSNYRRKQ
jgi:hypothetical protein